MGNQTQQMLTYTNEQVPFVIIFAMLCSVLGTGVFQGPSKPTEMPLRCRNEMRVYLFESVVDLQAK